MTVYHLKPNDHGHPVILHKPSHPTPLSSWIDSNAIATVIPGGLLPATLNGLPFDEWRDAPSSNEDWDKVEGQIPLDEPAFVIPPGKAAAAGVAIREPDGRIWLVSPSNGFGGYAVTLPKGRIDSGVNLQATAIREAFEESGLKVRIKAWLADASRTLTYTRYYLAERVGGTPASMGWESQAVHLVPPTALPRMLTHANDLPLLAALQRL
ncbi:NUDIX hydrolase [Massilia niastensis]|uniref:NUDIX hydrolase n=1 Tax=Massilia niastensis TaxID=544911 RepID=UPI0003621AC0|nr:NUDIX hydrolase [Massilia niastensis]